MPALWLDPVVLKGAGFLPRLPESGPRWCQARAARYWTSQSVETESFSETCKGAITALRTRCGDQSNQRRKYALDQPQ